MSLNNQIPFVRNVIALCLLSISSSTWQPGLAAKYHGRVQEGTSKRIARPIPAGVRNDAYEASAKEGQSVQSGQLDSGTFVIGRDASVQVPVVEADLSTRLLQGSTLSENTASTQATQAQRFSIMQSATEQNRADVVDYDSVEQQYAALVPPPPPPRASTCHGPSSCAHAEMDAAAYAQARYQQAMAQGVAPAPSVYTDDCICDRPIPSQECINERTSAIYGGATSAGDTRLVGMTPVQFSGVVGQAQQLPATPVSTSPRLPAYSVPTYTVPKYTVPTYTLPTAIAGVRIGTTVVPGTVVSGTGSVRTGR